MFFCRECKKTWTTITKSDVIKHVKACHDGDESLIEDHRMQYASDLHHITDKCFPRKSRGSLFFGFDLTFKFSIVGTQINTKRNENKWN